LIELPRYYDYHNNAFKMVEISDGSLRGYLLNFDTGRFEIANSLLQKILFSRGEDISNIDESEFVRITEINRKRYLDGEGEIFALYKQIDDWFTQRDKLPRDEWLNKRDLISELRRRSFRMWEDEFAHQKAGEPPSFRYWPIDDQTTTERRSRTDSTPDISPEQAADWFRMLTQMRADFDRAFNEADQPPNERR
jgi:hypothetical protein